ncbi:MAG: hypothetical protein DMF76_06935 [Acidobacteria bacterium]|nr:MAG: hypothetical protein DMF76_06935 [Acidobacteriota bacterium]
MPNRKPVAAALIRRGNGVTALRLNGIFERPRVGRSVQPWAGGRNRVAVKNAIVRSNQLEKNEPPEFIQTFLALVYAQSF